MVISVAEDEASRRGRQERPDCQPRFPYPTASRQAQCTAAWSARSVPL